MAQHSNTHSYHGFELKYPGYKGRLDYALFHDGRRPKHEDIVRLIHDLTNEDNFDEVVHALEDIHANGDSATTSFFTDEIKRLIFLVTLQEEVNYPPPANGKNLPFWRFYEAALAKVGYVDLADVVSRTNNHGKGAPRPYPTVGRTRPRYYC
jgi:hypothetical protein